MDAATILERELRRHPSAVLPSFAGHVHADLLDRLHRELLICIVDGRPLPNPWVYDRPWIRDAAMVGMVLRETGNLHLIEAWIMGRDDPYDRNNAGHEEPDNLGQALFLVSLVSDRHHPLVPKVLREVERVRVGDHLEGLTDFGPHPVYQTKWLKLGLRALGLDDPFVVPETTDSYSGLFWMDYRDDLGLQPRLDRMEGNYPYLQWAEAHSHGEPGCFDLLGSARLTWEANASQANYEGMGSVDPRFVAARCCVPHSWHAAEAFLHLLNAG